MARAGYCSKCKKNVFLTADSHCQFGHEPGCISKVYEVSNAGQQKEQGERSARRALTVFLSIIAVFFLCVLISSLNDKSQDTSPQTTTVEKDNVPPALTITQPADNSTTDKAGIVVVGTTEIDAKVTFNGTPSTVGDDGSFRGSVSLVSGKNTINVMAADLAGNKTEKVIYITYNPPPPPPPPVVQQAPASQTQEATVYITKTGECYHSAGCRYLSKSCIPISLSAAKQSYRP